MTSVAQKFWSDEQLLAIPKDGYDHEIIDGEEVMSPAGSEHGAIIMAIAGPLYTYVAKKNLGRVLDGQTGCRMKSGDLLSPDISFVENMRWETHRKAGEVFFHGSPDLVVEVLSPDDSLKIVRKKLVQYFANGAQMAWVVHPKKRSIEVHRAGASVRSIPFSGALDGANVVPGFKLELVQIFVR